MQPVPVHDHAIQQIGNLVANLEKLVELLIVLDDQEPALGVAQQERQLLRAPGRVDAADDSADALDAEIRVQPLLVVFREDRDHAAPPETQVAESQADRTGGFQEFLPGVALPDPEMLFAMGNPSIHCLAAAKEELRQRIAAVDLAASVPTVRCIAYPVSGSRNSPRSVQGDPPYRQVFRRFQRRSPLRPSWPAPR